MSAGRRAAAPPETLTPLTERWPEITIEDAYHVSLRMVNRRIEEDGEKIKFVDPKEDGEKPGKKS